MGTGSAGEQTIGVAPDGTGKKVRNLEDTALQADGSTPLVEMQVVVLADKNGRLADFSNLEGLLSDLNDNITELIYELRLMNETEEE